MRCKYCCNFVIPIHKKVFICPECGKELKIEPYEEGRFKEISEMIK